MTYRRLLCRILFLSLSITISVKALPLGSPNLESGLKGRTDIVYFTDFESVDWLQDWRGFARKQNLRLVDEDASEYLHQSFSGKALEVTIPQGKHYGTSGKFVFKDKLGYEPEELYVRFYTYYARDFGDRPESQGYRGKAPGFDGTYGVEGWGGKPNTDGTKGWSCRGSSSGASQAEGVRFGYYSYAVKTGTYNYGRTLHYDKPIPYDQWVCVEQYLRLNTPGKADGIARAWLDGELVFEKTDYLWRNTHKLKIHSYWVDYYRGGKQPAYHDHHVYLDNLVIATEKRVGLYTSPKTTASIPGPTLGIQEPADLIILNAKVVTIDDAYPRAEAIAMKGEWIIQVGTHKEIRPYIAQDKTRVIDARGRLVVPGFNDSHVHVLGGGHSLLNLDFRNLKDVQTILQMVKERVAQIKPGVLIRGRSWDHELFPDKAWPTRQMLDAVAPENPVILSRVDGHSRWVNSLVLNMSGITRDTPDPAGGTIVRDPQTREPTGILKERAQGLIKVRESLTAEDRLTRDSEALEKALALARQKGVTSLQDMTWGDLRSLVTCKQRGRLTARITFGVPLTDQPKRLENYKRLRRQYPPTGNWIRFGLLKGFADGTLGSGTALMFKPFLDDPSTAGLAMMPYDDLERRVLAADRLGFQVGIHAIGSKANHWILNAYDKARQVHGPRDRRFRSEHAQILADRDIPRFAASEVIASMQPTHCITDKRFAEKRLGRKRCSGAYAWQRLLNKQARLAFGTDWPVEPLDPLEGLYAAVTRKDRAGEPGDGWFPDQRLTMEKTIELYTAGSAYAEFMEDRKGRIKEGFLADVVVFDRDLLTIPPDQIMQARVDYTIVGGKVVFER